MSSEYTILAVEIENLHLKENEMYTFYSDLLKDLKNVQIKEKIRHIRNQELGHIKMVTNMTSILREDIAKG